MGFESINYETAANSWNKSIRRCLHHVKPHICIAAVLKMQRKFAIIRNYHCKFVEKKLKKMQKIVKELRWQTLNSFETPGSNSSFIRNSIGKFYNFRSQRFNELWIGWMWDRTAQHQNENESEAINAATNVFGRCVRSFCCDLMNLQMNDLITLSTMVSHLRKNCVTRATIQL